MKKGRVIMSVLLCASMVLGLFGCTKKEYTVGSDVKEEEITEFYWTESTSTFPPYFQRYRLYTEEGKHFFYHEKREGEAFPLTEKYITVSGTRELTEEEWQTFFELLKDGTVKKRQESTESGNSGPWTYLYWKGDKGDIQEFSFSSYEKAKAFEEACIAFVKEEEEESLVKKVDLEGSTMEYIRFGNKEGEKLVILPGLSLKSVMGSAEGIVQAYSLLAEDYDIYLFDHVKEEPVNYTIEDMAVDTKTAMEILGLDHVHLMGVSMGGMVAQTLTLLYPECVDSLILCSTTSRVFNTENSVIEKWKQLAEERDLSALVESFGEKVYTPSFYETYKDIILHSGDGASETDFRNFLRSIEAIEKFDVYEELEMITCPVFVLGAGEDQVVGVQASRDIAEKLGCEIYVYEGYGHGVYDEAPDYLSRIQSFLKENR